MKGTQRRRPCPTCGGPIDRGPGQYAYCSEECRPTCIHPECDRKARGRGNVCDRHRAHLMRHGELRPNTWTEDWVCVVCGKDVPKGSGRRKHCSVNCQQLDYRHKGNRPKTAKCKLCGRTFSLMSRNGKRLQRTDTQWCPDCGRNSAEARRYKKYKVTPDAYAAALLLGCDICGEVVDNLHIDHDHKCCPTDKYSCGKCVRGFLCGPCNRAIGMMKDNPERLRKAAAYLER